MKLSKFVNLLAVALVLIAGATGCKKKPVDVTKLPGYRAGGVDDPGLAGTLGMTPLGEAGSHAGWAEDPQTLSPQTVHFDYDSSAVKAADKIKVAAVADYLRSNSANAVRVEGHCDERGTEEYNRSLGERRALAVREELIRLGVEPGRVDTISYGEDRPTNSGHDESAWRDNRRAEFIVLSPPR